MPAKKVAVVSLNAKGEVLGYYESMKEAGRAAGVDPCTISNAVRMGVWCRKHLWMYEEDYRKHWMNGDVSKLGRSYKEYRKEVQRKRLETMGEEGRLRWKQKHSERRKAYLREHPDSIISPRKPVFCVTTGEVFESASAFARHYNTHPSNTCRSARDGGRIKGMIVKYITKEEYEEYNQRRNKEND